MKMKKKVNNKQKVSLIRLMDKAFHATAGFQDSEFCQKAMKVASG